jgi:hypothetical protein
LRKRSNLKINFKYSEKILIFSFFLWHLFFDSPNAVLVGWRLLLDGADEDAHLIAADNADAQAGWALLEVDHPNWTLGGGCLRLLGKSGGK